MAKMENNTPSVASAEAKAMNAVVEALHAASCAVEGNAGDSCERLWEVVSGDSLAGSFFLKSLSNSLDTELPTSLLRCTKLEDVVERVKECAARAGADQRNKIPARNFQPEKKVPRVAIVNASCRLPGGVEILGDLWSDILLPGKDAVTQIPTSRWDVELLYDPEGGDGTVYVREGGFIENADAFDNRFFEIPDHEVSHCIKPTMKLQQLGPTVFLEFSRNCVPLRRHKWTLNNAFFWRRPLKRGPP